MSDEKLKSIYECLRVVGTPEGDAMLKAYLDSEPFPHFEGHPTVKGALIRIEEDGKRTAGKFVDRKFVPLEEVAAEADKPSDAG
jgi:hypothetical protein